VTFRRFLPKLLVCSLQSEIHDWTYKKSNGCVVRCRKCTENLGENALSLRLRHNIFSVKVMVAIGREMPELHRKTCPKRRTNEWDQYDSIKICSYIQKRSINTRNSECFVRSVGSFYFKQTARARVWMMTSSVVWQLLETWTGDSQLASASSTKSRPVEA